MPMCERCWDSAFLDGMYHELGQAGAYGELVKVHRCTPEQRAGKYARWCVSCERQTSHQHCDTCVICGSKGGIGGRLEDFA